MPLLQLLARLRTMATQPDPADLRTRTEAELHHFEQRAEAAGFAADQIRRAHYALCASLDDAVLNTPWGSKGAWAAHPLLALFHPAVSADRFFDVLQQAQDKAPTHRPALELMYLCLSLGFLGPLRTTPNGPAEAERRRDAAAAILARHASPIHPDLAPAWRGVHAPFVLRRTRFPLWVAACAALAVLAGMFLLLTLRLNTQSDALFADMLAAPPAAMPDLVRDAIIPPPPAPEPSVQDRLRARLEAAPGVTVAGIPASPVVRIPARLLFTGPTAEWAPGAEPLLQRVAEALKTETSRLTVIGYTDNRPIHTVLFPSSFQLSAAQAQAVRAVLAGLWDDPAAVLAEGRGSATPVAPNTTAEGRDQNRRIELVLDPARP